MSVRGVIPCTCQLYQEGAEGGATRRLPLLPTAPTAKQTEDSSVEPLTARACGVSAVNGGLKVLGLITPLHNGDEVAGRQVNRLLAGENVPFEIRVLQTLRYTSYVRFRP